ncbi:MAG: metal-dependent transcriptional regulator [Candidatus Eisenbacteria bacterium]|nr:metal-dependent transcriptional regulator [Candidatus Eisenbacteria bacterium]
MTASLTRSRQDYLKALHDLGQDAPVTVTALARRLGVSAPSVTNMLARLAGERLVRLHRRGAARLSAVGERAALQVVRRHRILETFLVNVLGLDWADVHEDAEVLEHHVSDRVLGAIDRLCGHPSEDPHGHPIPDRHGRIARRALVPLASLRAGEKGVVREIRDRDVRRMVRWKAAGLVPGAAVRMRAVRSEDGVLEIEVAGSAFVSAGAAVDGVLVQLGRGRADA